MTWLKRILTAVAALIVLFVVVGLFLPKTYEYETAIVIESSPEMIHPYVNDLEQWPEWMPFYEDPDLEITPGDAMKGVDANQIWKDASGEGRIEMTAADETTGVVYDISFVDGKVAGSSAITYVNGTEESDIPVAEWASTRVVWTMEGTYADLVTRWMGAVMSGSTRGYLETGLRNLKRLVEQGPEEDDPQESGPAVG